MLFNFQLKSPLECGLSIDSEGNRHVSWFWLTDSFYYIDLGTVRLFESSPPRCEKYQAEHHNIQFLDYQYSRQLEDLFEILPQISCPMPESLYNHIDTDEKLELLWDKVVDVLWEAPTEEMQNEIDEIFGNLAANVINYGNLDSGHLRFRSTCKFFHVNDKIIIRYNFLDNDEEGDPVWTAGKGVHTILYTEFVNEIESLYNRFFTAMDQQVQSAMQVFRKIELQNSNLMAEHADRKHYFYGVLNSIKKNGYEHLVDWEKIQEDLDKYINNTIK